MQTKNFGSGDAYPKLIAVIGTNGTGKTTFIHDVYADEFKRVNPSRTVYFVDVYGNLKNKRDDFVYLDDFSFDIWSKMRKCLVVVDDMRMFFNRNDEPEMRRMFIQRRHAEVDTVLVYHSFADVHRIVFRYATNYYIFRTNDRYDEVKKKIGNEKITREVVRKSNMLEKYFFIKVKV